MILSRYRGTSGSRKVRAAIIAVFFVSVFIVFGAVKETTGQTDPELRLKWYGKHVAMKNSSMFKNLVWQFLGPTNISGRMTDTAVVVPKGKNYMLYLRIRFQLL